ncbi:hypothetical protein D3C77_256960 [compost metagenome]
MHFQIIKGLGIVRRISFNRFYQQIIKTNVIVSAAKIHPAGQLGIRIGVGGKLCAIKVGCHLIARHLNGNVMPCVISVVKAIDLHAAGTSHDISVCHRTVVGLQLPVAVVPEFQHIWRTIDGVGAASALIPCANRGVICAALGMVRFERNVDAGLIVGPSVIADGCDGLAVVPRTAKSHKPSIQLLAQNIITGLLVQIRLERTVAVMGEAGDCAFWTAAGFNIALGARNLAACSDHWNRLAGIVKIVRVKNTVPGIPNRSGRIGVEHGALALNGERCMIYIVPAVFQCRYGHDRIGFYRHGVNPASIGRNLP